MLFTKTGRLGQEQVRREQDRNHGENKTPVTYSWRNMLQAAGHVILSSKGGLGLKTLTSEPSASTKNLNQ